MSDSNISKSEEKPDVIWVASCDWQKITWHCRTVEFDTTINCTDQRHPQHTPPLTHTHSLTHSHVDVLHQWRHNVRITWFRQTETAQYTIIYIYTVVQKLAPPDFVL